jgi:hypothetical protein
MAIPKRNRRVIVVDGDTYHWTRGHSKRADQGWVTIQHADGRGSLLRIDLFGVPTPADIAEGIRFAIAHGWRPTMSDEAFHLGFTDQRSTERFVVRSATSPDFWREFVK